MDIAVDAVDSRVEHLPVATSCRDQQEDGSQHHQHRHHGQHKQIGEHRHQRDGVEVMGCQGYRPQHCNNGRDGGRGQIVDPSVAAFEPLGHAGKQQHSGHCDETQLETDTVE